MAGAPSVESIARGFVGPIIIGTIFNACLVRSKRPGAIVQYSLRSEIDHVVWYSANADSSVHTALLAPQNPVPQI